VKIGILGDTHRNKALHAQVLDRLLNTDQAVRIYHLGDDYRDTEVERELGTDLLQVPGLYCPEYADKTVENVVVDTVQGVNILLVHDLKDVSEQEIMTSDILLYGHSHKAEIKIVNGKLYLNPGHLKAPQDKGKPPSYGFLDIDYGTLQADIRQANGKVMSSMTLKKSETGLYKI
jgi:putative phosphoesterase